MARSRPKAKPISLHSGRKSARSALWRAKLRLSALRPVAGLKSAPPRVPRPASPSPSRSPSPRHRPCGPSTTARPRRTSSASTRSASPAGAFTGAFAARANSPLTPPVPAPHGWQRDIVPPPRQLGRHIRHDHALRPHDETDQPRLGADLSRRNALAFGLVLSSRRPPRVMRVHPRPEIRPRLLVFGGLFGRGHFGRVNPASMTRAVITRVCASSRLMSKLLENALVLLALAILVGPAAASSQSARSQSLPAS